MPHKVDIKSLFYITHVENVPSILKNGILSHGLVEAQKVPFTPIYDTGIVSNRKEKSTPDHKSLWEYANLYFQPRNPMMYRVIHEKSKRDLAVIGVKPAVLQLASVFVTDGNAANNPTQFFRTSDGLKVIEEQWKVIQSEWWNDQDSSKRKIMAECLVPDAFPRNTSTRSLWRTTIPRCRSTAYSVRPLSRSCRNRTSSSNPCGGLKSVRMSN